MAKKCCCCSFFSCFSGNYTQPPPAQQAPDNNAPPAVSVAEAPDLRCQEPQTPLPASTPLPICISHDAASSSAESASSAAPTQNESPATVAELTKKITEDAAVVDGENGNINFDGLIEDIAVLLKIIKTKSSDKRPSTGHYWPGSSNFLKLKEILSEAADGASALKDTISSEAMKEVKNLLTGIGQAHWAAAGLLVVANILERIETVSANRDECLSLLEEMYNLAQHVKDLKERAGSKKGMEASIKKASDMIVEGALMCCTQMNTSRISRFFSASVNKDDLAKFQQKLQKMYRRMDNQKFICILDAIECVNVRPPVKERERSYPEYAVGIEEQLEEVIELLQWESNKNALAVVVHGFGGMGKTTLADAVFARLYIGGCKYSMVRLFEDINSTPNIIKLQKCILTDLMLGSKEEDQKPVFEKIRTFEDGQREIGRILEKEVSFIYIDNALSKDSLEKLLPKNMENAKKVRLLITTRDREVRKGCLMNAVEFYRMKFLGDTEAMKLLKEEMYYGKTEDRELLKCDQLQRVVNLCGGVPKLLSVLARFIRLEEGGQQKAFRILMEEIEEKKKWNAEIGDIDGYLFAFDRLPEQVKDPFLDICSFFIGWDWNEVTNIVEEFNLDILEKRGLVSKDRNMAVTVHDVILKVGQQKTEGTRFTFRSASEIAEFLKKDIQGVKGISLNELSEAFYIPAIKLDLMSHSLRILALGEYAKVEGTCEQIFEKLVFFQGEVGPYLPFLVSRSKDLRFLKCKPQDLNLLNEIPSNLKHMELDGELVLKDAFEISSSDLQKHHNMRILRLFNFKGLGKLSEKLGDILSCLQELSFQFCESLEELPASISKLQSLRKLDMYGCSSLKQLPEDFGSLSSLQALDFSYCESIEKLPRSFSKLQSLRKLDMGYCSSLKQLPEDFGSLSSLQTLDLISCKSIEELPGLFPKLQSLRELNMTYCSSLKKLPEDFGSLSSLQALDFSFCESIEELPGSISKLQSLRVLDMRYCSSLKRLPDDFGYLSSLQALHFSSCESIEKLPGSFSKLQSLRELDMRFCSSLKKLPEDFGSLSSLQELTLSFCNSIEELPGSISKLQSLRELRFCDCSSLKQLPEDFGSLSSLQALGFSLCKSIEELPGSISKLQSLREWDMGYCSSLKRLPDDFGYLSSLQELTLSYCNSIEELPGSISKLQSLRELYMDNCSSVKRLPEDFGSLSSLQELRLSFCHSIEELPGSISKLQSLRELYMDNCSSLKRLPEDFGSLISLQVLRLAFCHSIEELPGSISKLQSLRELDMTSCKSLKRLPENFMLLTPLEILGFEDCPSLDSSSLQMLLESQEKM